MRIWVVPPEDLDNQRLLGAHNEIHMAIGLINESLRRGRIHGLLKDWYHPEGFAAIAHYHELCVMEMAERGMHGHQTPLKFPVELEDKLKEGQVTVLYLDNHWPPMFVTIAAFLKDVKDLTERWTRENKEEWLKRFRKKYGENLEQFTALVD